MGFRESLKSERRWTKKVILIHFYHNTMILKYGDKWSVRKTAHRLSISNGAASEAIRLCKAMLDDPGLEKCKTRNEALSKLNGK